VALREALEANDGELVATLVQTAIDNALAGDFRFWKEIVDCVEGKALNRLGVSAEAPSITDLPGLTPEQLEAITEMEGGPK